MPIDIRARWQRLETRQKTGIVIAAVFVFVMASAFFAPASPAPTDTLMDAKISALKAQTAAVTAEAAAVNKLADDLKSKEPSWTIVGAKIRNGLSLYLRQLSDVSRVRHTPVERS
jgi:type II secretory pathway component PulM